MWSFQSYDSLYLEITSNIELEKELGKNRSHDLEKAIPVIAVKLLFYEPPIYSTQAHG